MNIKDWTLYRPCVGIALFNAQNQVFVGKRLDTTVEAWQMPQGGIDDGEKPIQALWRELFEEVGTNKAEIIGELDDWHYYDLPPELKGKLWQGKYIGQRQRWFALRFTGTDSDINILTEHPEFCAWQWVNLNDVPKLIVPFKQELYQSIAGELAALVGITVEKNS
jgi:putative (di)nucleoside polyphosphate hydrolase